MPLYVYRCRLGHATELRRGREVTAETCAQCGGVSERCVVQTFAIGGEAEVRYPLSRFIEADGEMKLAAERAGETPPDVIGAAERRAQLARSSGRRP